MRVGYVLKVYPRLSQTFIVNEIRAHEAAGLEVVVFSLRRPKASDLAVLDGSLRSSSTSFNENRCCRSFSWIWWRSNTHNL